MSCRILVGDALAKLREMPGQQFHCCVTSPPYYGLRDYGVDGQMGSEKTPAQFVVAMVEVFREVRRVLRDDGTLWMNVGDSSAPKNSGIKPKNILGMPWMLAFALRADGWCLRQDIIWHKPNPMPESVKDRCTKAHEYIFLMSKSPRYYYDAEAIRTPLAQNTKPLSFETMDYERRQKYKRPDGWASGAGAHGTIHPQGREKGAAAPDDYQMPTGANKRSVWSIANYAYPGAHFATFPPALVEPCILAGCPQGGVVLDPFGGAGTTGLVANRLLRNSVLIELNADYAAMARDRIMADGPLIADVELAA